MGIVSATGKSVMNEQTEQQKKTASALQDLLTRAYDAEQGYHNAAEAISHDRLKSLFHEYAEQRKSFGHDIKALIVKNGETPDKGASALGKLHQFWIDFRGMLTGGGEADIIEECRRGEETTMSDYEDYINDLEISAEARELFSQQLEKVRTIYSRLTSLENKAAAAEAVR